MSFRDFFTGNHLLKEVDDPAFVHTVSRLRQMSFGLIAAVMFLIGAAGYMQIQTAHESERITQIEHSACQVDAAGRECQKTKVEASRAASIATTCIPFFKAGYPCPKPGSSAAQRQATRQLQAHPNPSQSLDSSGGGERASSGTGNAPAPAHPGTTQPPAPHHPGSAPGPAPAGTGSPSPSEPAPSASTSFPLPSSPASPSETPTTSAAPKEPSQPISEPLAPVLETVHGVVCSLLHPC